MAEQTLRELLQNTPNIPIKLKTCSSRWVYAYYNDENAFTRINKESNKIIKGWQDKLFMRVSYYDNLDDLLKRKLELIKHSKKINPKDKERQKDKAIKKYLTEKETLPIKIESQKAKIQAFVPYLDRKVKRVWNLPCMGIYENPNTLYIEISGREIGEYDDIHEYAKRHHLQLRKEDSFWRKNLSKKPKPQIETKQLKMVKPTKKTRFRTIRNVDGHIIGLQEISEQMKRRK